ncbi:transcriptional regulator, AraC family [Aquitalea magnusonii]|uniref:Transcriptional regulator, AraC family n=1 Tax=Aquitalea magnusonii TaxID=332411 RepID=A0A3G9GCN8_9NEIS|nr:transcriptional regulator, AraC family [Aquitalea magnusonii]
MLVLDADLLQQFRLQYAEQVLALLAHPPQLFSPIQGTMRQLWDELFAAVTRSESEPLLRHRAQGLLLALALAGLGGVLFADRETGVADRLRQTMLLQPGRDWRLAELAHQFFMGESTLRRKLDQEGHSFRKILDQVRLNTALGLLQSTQLPIGEIARQCGYASHSRFSQRFQKQFGIKPMQLRATHP